MLEPLYKNNQVIALIKPAGIPLQPDKTGEQSFQEMAEAYCQHPLFVVHRIDRPVGGVVLFAKSKNAARAINEQFKKRAITKTYLAVVSVLPDAPEGTLVHFIQKNAQQNRSYASLEETPGSERAELHYKVLGSSERYHLLLIHLMTGRHHQIRVQLASIGCFIKGDVKYGARRNNTDRSIHLHAWKIAFDHPVTGSRVSLEAPIPSEDSVWAAMKAYVPAE